MSRVRVIPGMLLRAGARPGAASGRVSNRRTVGQGGEGGTPLTRVHGARPLVDGVQGQREGSPGLEVHGGHEGPPGAVDGCTTLGRGKAGTGVADPLRQDERGRQPSGGGGNTAAHLASGSEACFSFDFWLRSGTGVL